MPARPLETLEALVGTSKRTVEGLLVEAGKVDEFATAIREDDPVYREEAVAHERGFDAIPATMIHTMCALFERYHRNGGPLRAFDLGYDQRYTVLGEQAYEYARPAVVGDVLGGVTTLTSVHQRDGSGGTTMTLSTLSTAYTDTDDEPVVTVERTLIETRDPATDGHPGDGE